MYDNKTGLVLGFHGCDKSVRDAVIKGEYDLKPSLNDYDWLGNGIYFWESDPQRALEWANQLANRKSSSVKEPAVLGAVIDLGHCFDLMNRQSVRMLAKGYELLKNSCAMNDEPIPQNRNVKGNNDFLYRNLDCAVIQLIHEMMAKGSGTTPFDSVRGLFLEGKAAYDGSCFKEKTHVQLCIINPNCIKGYFLPRNRNYDYPSV